MKPFIILIGDNNISNYTLIKFLRKNGFDFDEVVVVYTKKTIDNKNYLKKLVKQEFIEINVEDKKEKFLEVKQEILDKLNELKNIEKIFLDFTGGLKSMSLGAYLAIDEYELDESNKYISYVVFDFDKKESKVFFKRGEEYKLDESLSIEEIAGVHGIFELDYKTSNSDFFSVESVLWLLDKIQNEEKEFFEDLWDKKFKELKDLKWKESLKDYLFKIENLSNNQLKYLQKYIKSDFLEEYIFYMLNEIKDEVGISEIAWNVRKGKEAKFEVDVIASKDNNLYLFSCTTDKSKNIVKQKGFEAKEKATQLGGKNGTMILVSCIDENWKQELLEDLEEKKGGNPPKIIVFEDLIDYNKLKQKLKEIF